MPQPDLTLAPPGIEPSHMHRQVFMTLCRATVNQIAGCFDPAFWAHDILRATQVSPAVWHAALALAAMDCRKKIPAETEKPARQQYYTFSLLEYNKSIHQLITIARQIDDTSFNDQETILISNALLFGLDCLQGHHKEATAHARNSIELFYRWRFWEQAEKSAASSTRSSLVHSGSLIALIMNFECQFINRLSHLISPTWLGNKKLWKSSSESFTSVTDAYLEFLPLLTSFMDATRFIGSPPDLVQPRPDIQVAYRHEFMNWNTKFDDMLRLQNPSTPSDLEGIAVLQMFFTTLEIGFKIDLAASQVAYDVCESLFERIINQAEDLYKIIAVGVHQEKTATSFSFSLPLSDVFIYTANNCRNSVLRRRLMSLVRKWPHSDGLWNSKLTVTLCEAVVLAEEYWMSAARKKPILTADVCYCIPTTFVCDNHRVRDLDTYFTSERQARVWLRTVGDLRNNLPGTEITVTW
ncbi:hypothetical protein J3458_001571 [Metarhizium acridum]|nr:hypothetical protein J3458_001571 [Metarhizium acridum]